MPVIAGLQLKFPAHVIITLTSEHDPYLYLLEGEGVTGAVLYENDDTDGTNSRIEATLQPGIYTIEATTYEEGVTGLLRGLKSEPWNRPARCAVRQWHSRARALTDNPSTWSMNALGCLDAKYILSRLDPPLNWSADCVPWKSGKAWTLIKYHWVRTERRSCACNRTKSFRDAALYGENTFEGFEGSYHASR